jgi:sorting and assembly machinery component 37
MLDLSLAAHILLLINAPLPDTLLSSLLSSSYPTLILHARRVLGDAMPTTRVLSPERYKLSALLPYPSFRAWWNEPHRPKSEEEKRFERMRWRWIGLAIVGSIGYWLIWGPKLRLVRVADEDGEESLAIVQVVEGGTVVLDADEEEEEEEEEEGDGGGNEEH